MVSGDFEAQADRVATGEFVILELPARKAIENSRIDEVQRFERNAGASFMSGRQVTSCQH
jgi:hypothetical protein